MTHDQDDNTITRLEVIDDTGRILSIQPCHVTLAYQDDNKTLKVFVTRSMSQQRRLQTVVPS